jgi:glucosamine--fructose-6-phosphate aminotransferase (isomerizing)
MVTVLESEILSQSTLLRERTEEGTLAAKRAAALWDPSFTHLVVAARGSSDCAATYLQYLAGQELGLLTALGTPSLYAPPHHLNLAGSMVVAISQSGRSPDIVAVLKAAKAQGRPTVAITNDVESPLAHEADDVIPLLVGPEISLAATKTLLASLQAVAQFVKALGGPREVLTNEDELPAMVASVTSWALDYLGPVLSSVPFEGLTVVGRGLGLSAAEECALKIREVAGIRAEAYAAPDLLHGPIGAEGKGSSMWLVLTDEIDDEAALDLLTRAKDSGLSTIVSRLQSRKATSADLEIVMPIDCPNWITPFL